MKKVFSFALLVIVFVNLCSPQLIMAEEYKLYADSSNEYYADFLGKLGIWAYHGDGEIFFGDDTAVKRGEAAKALVSLLGYDVDTLTGSVSHIYTDVPDYHEDARAIASAVANGVMIGVDTGVFAPDESLKVEHFLKALIVALGYDHEAKIRGGYPTGYTAVAVKLDLLDNTGCNVNEVLTRGMMVRILCNAIKVDICLPVAVGNEKIVYRVEENVTILSHYHNIHVMEGIVNSNNITSLKSKYEPANDRIIIGDEEVFISDSEIFSYIGYNAECYVRKTDGRKTLVSFEILPENEVYLLGGRDIISVDSKNIAFEDEKGKQKDVKIGSEAQIFVNGSLVTQNIDSELESVRGMITVINNDGDRNADIIFAENYIYDKVDYTDIEKEVIYLDDMSVSYGKKKLSIIQPDGNSIEPQNLSGGTVVAIAQSADGQVIIIRIIGMPVGITIDTVSDDEIIAESGDIYFVAPSAVYLTDPEPGKKVAVAANSENELVWMSEEGDAANVGFLIRTATVKNAFNTRVQLKILKTDNTVSTFEISGDKLEIDNKLVEKENIEAYLKSAKDKLNITADGETAQVVYYVLNKSGELKTLYTAGNGGLFINYNYKERGKAYLRDHGWNSAVFAYGYALTSAVPIFRVPLENMDSYDEKYFTVTKYSTSNFKDGGTFEFDSYIKNEDDILPGALVYYKTASQTVAKTGAFFLVDKVASSLDPEGMVTTKLTGYSLGAAKTYFADTSANLSFADVDKGDILVFALDNLDYVVAYDKVYDLSTDTVNPDYVTSSTADASSVKVMHVYNAPKGSSFIQAYYDGYENGVPGDEKKALFNFIPYNNGGSRLMSFDLYNKKGKIGGPERVVDYLHDSQNYAKIVIRYSYNFQSDAVIYQ